MHALLISTYELGRQPFGLASPAAWLRAAEWSVDCIDMAKVRLTDDAVAIADLVAVYLPMHTATRLAGPVIGRIRRLNPTVKICTFGLYAPLNEAWLRSLGVDEVLGGEFEEELTRIATAMDVRVASSSRERSRLGPSAVTEVAPHELKRMPADTSEAIPRLKFLVPDRRGLPALDKYATLQQPDGSRTLAGYTEASRGCRHLCRHCPVVPVYNGQFRVVPPEVVLGDIANQVAAGAGHITFGDPDFFNGPTHALRIVDGLHAQHPSLTYDVTIKVEHLIRHRALLPRLRDTGCLFITSAVESIDDRVLERLEKGHTLRDFIDVVGLCRDAGLTFVPTFVAFHPWITLDGYCDLLDTIERLDLIGHVSPVQLALRLLIPEGSRLLELDDVRQLVGAFDPATLAYRWAHSDPRVDRLQQDLSAIVGVRLAADRLAVFDEVSGLARERAGRAGTRTGGTRRIDPRDDGGRDVLTVPYLNEPWYCCAEPNPEQMNPV
jgi:hypothetical protein